ncbi:glycosyltransferase [Thalassotalea atypica]|uniref:glycosyltransferase n=1 Tax=Thalassotalea atypica TaxID=2054316 RepID=UPI0025728D08|nr:glycosyltransferase [Thalassotalea atypica]
MAKLLLVIDCLGSGGAQRQLVSLARQFCLQGHQVELFVYFPQFLHFKKELEEFNITIHSVEKRSRFSIKPVLAIARLLKEKEYDGALSFMQSPAIYLQIAYLFHRTIGGKYCKIVFSERTTYPHDKPLSWAFRLSQQVHRIAHNIVANSHHQKQKMAETFPWMKKKLLTIYNGLDDTQFAEVNPIDGKENYLLCVSRVVQYKNYYNLVLALIEYNKKWGRPPKIKWLGKIFQDKENLQTLKKVNALLTAEGLAEQLEFIGESSDVSHYYQQAAALIHPSFIEGFSNVVMEASRYGLPLLLGNIGDHRWLLEKYPAGLIFDVNNPTSIAQSIREFTLAPEQELVQWQQASYQASKDLFQITQASQQYLELLLVEKSTHINSFLMLGTLPPPVGGVTISVKNQMIALQSKDIEVNVFPSKIIRFHDVAHVHSYQPWKRLLLLMLGKLRAKINVFTIHGMHFDEKSIFGRLCVALVDGVVVLNEDVLETAPILKKKPFLKSTSLVAEGIEQEKDRKLILPRVKSKPRVLVYAQHGESYDGQPIYGVPFILENIDTLIQHYTLVIVDLSDCYTEFSSFCTEDVIRFNKPVDFIQLLNEVDVYLRPTSKDGDAIAIHESLIQGTPVVASNVVSRPIGVHEYDYLNMDSFLDAIEQALTCEKIVKKPNLSSINEYLQFYNELRDSK